MNEMGVNEPPTFEDAVETIRKAGLELPPVSAVTNQLADAAVQLVDNGFFFLARVCIFQMWRTMATMSSAPSVARWGRGDIEGPHRAICIGAGGRTRQDR